MEYSLTEHDCPACKMGQLVETLDEYYECNQCDYVREKKQ